MFVLGYSIPFFLEYSLIVLNSLKDDVEALNLLSENNYTRDTIDNELNRHSIAQEMESAQIQYHADMINVGAEFDKLYDYSHEQFMDYSGIILLEFKNDMDVKLNTLAMAASGERNNIEWMKKAKEFYNYVLRSSRIMTRIAQYNFTSERLQAAIDKIVEAENAKSKFLNLKGKAQESINTRNKALKELETGMRKLIKVATMSFKSVPQYMEKCGIVVLSEGYKRVRNSSNTSSKTAKTTVNVEMPADME
jgi:hypothetical protein